MRIGYEVFYTTPGSVHEMRCRVCNRLCDAKRDVYGPANWTTSMARKYDYYDVFICPQAESTWHEQALKLLLAIEDTPSKRLAELMKQDLDELLVENGIEPSGDKHA